ncbi:MAG: hypothetical protein DBX44_04120 [Oscillospiraceae bacterium]|nr:MAG: hypothetical protein DBX44_04120 [Oscillospiraceae bacterium]
MKATQKISFLLALACVFVCICGCASSSAPASSSAGSAASGSGEAGGIVESQIVIGTSTSGGTWQPIGIAMSQLWNESSGSNCSISASTSDGGNENILRLGTNDQQFAMCATATCLEAMNKSGSFEGMDVYDDFLVMFNMYPTVFQMPVLKTSGIESIWDITGKSINLGAAGSGSRSMNVAILKALGIDESSFDSQAISHSNAIDMVIDEKMDGYMIVGDSGQSHQMKAMSSNKMIMLGLGSGPNGDEDIATVISKEPYFYELTIPANTYPDQDYDVKTVAQGTLLICRSDISEELVYEFTKLVWENLDYLETFNAVFSQMSLEDACNVGGLPMHPGAIRYFEEVGVL